MNKMRIFGQALGIGVLGVALAACSTANDGGWISNGFHQWHPQTGKTTVSSTGTQCYFCPGEFPDSDKDGVPDSKDKCPNTPAGTKVDADGCGADQDQDGVPDSDDKCPDTPKGVAVDKQGCGLDSDKDGVPDFLDKCPGTPAGTPVDRQGCGKESPKDTDGDGVVDGTDQCPGTPAGVKPDVRGCWVLQNLHFDTDSAVIKEEGRRVLDEAIVVLKRNAGMRFEVDGHTDRQGSAKHNKQLSMKRADAVRDYLIKGGVEAGRLSVKGFGYDVPASDNKSAEGRRLNRRVELKPMP
ncbi:MAG: OmpA family protein [Magnetococcales bacterium]|nr:OmpA family protein [Magnetococcales bacterium]